MARQERKQAAVRARGRTQQTARLLQQSSASSVSFLCSSLYALWRPVSRLFPSICTRASAAAPTLGLRVGRQPYAYILCYPLSPPLRLRYPRSSSSSCPGRRRPLLSCVASVAVSGASSVVAYQSHSTRNSITSDRTPFSSSSSRPRRCPRPCPRQRPVGPLPRRLPRSPQGPRPLRLTHSEASMWSH